MISYVPINPYEEHSKKPCDWDPDLCEILDNLFSMHCFAEEHEFLNVFSMQKASSEQIFMDQANWLQTYMLTNASEFGKWIGYVQFYNEKIVKTHHLCSMLSSIDMIQFFPENVRGIMSEEQIGSIKQAIACLLNEITPIYKGIDRTLTNMEYERLKQTFMGFKERILKEGFATPEMEHQWYIQTNILRNTVYILNTYYEERLNDYLSQCNSNNELFMNVFMASDFLTKGNKQAEIYGELSDVLKQLIGQVRNLSGEEIDIIVSTSIQNPYLNDFSRKTYIKKVS